MYTLDYSDSFSFVDSLTFSSLTELIEFLQKHLPESEGIYVGSPEWDGGYVASYPGICDNNGQYIPVNETLSAKHFRGEIPPDAIELINKIRDTKMSYVMS